MTNLSIKKLYLLLIISTILLLSLLFYIGSIILDESNLPMVRLLNSPFKDELLLPYDEKEKDNDKIQSETENSNKIKENEKMVDNIDIAFPFNNISEPSKSSGNRISEELIPNPDSLKKDAIIDQQKINSIKDLKLKTPKGEHGEFHHTFGKKVAFIYFSHNRESFLPYFNKGAKPEEAYHSEFNITLIGERLGKALKGNGIGNSVEHADIITMLNSRNLNFNHSYQMSRELVKEEIKNNRNVEMLFDIHRDSLPKHYTTLNINGDSFAKISFVIGSGHKDYKNNLAFTNALNDLINKSYPGRH